MRMFGVLGALAAIAVGTAGCSRPTTTYTDAAGNKMQVGQDGKVSVTDDKGRTATYEANDKGGTMTMKDEKGETKVEAGKGVTETDLGLPFYPGSVETTGASFKADTPEGTSAMSVRTTADEPAKVIDFYKSKVKTPQTMTAGDANADIQMVHGTTDTGAKVTVTAKREKGKTETEVGVTVVTEKKK